MDFKQASKGQLIAIAYWDDMAKITDRIQAAEELKRRSREKHGRTNFKEKAHLPR